MKRKERGSMHGITSQAFCLWPFTTLLPFSIPVSFHVIVRDCGYNYNDHILPFLQDRWAADSHSTLTTAIIRETLKDLCCAGREKNPHCVEMFYSLNELQAESSASL